MCLSFLAFHLRQGKIKNESHLDKQPAVVDVLQSVFSDGEKDDHSISAPVPDPARVCLDVPTINVVSELLRRLSSFDIAGHTDDDAEQYDDVKKHIHRVVEYVNGTVDELYGKESNDSTYSFRRRMLQRWWETMSRGVTSRLLAKTGD